MGATVGKYAASCKLGGVYRMELGVWKGVRCIYRGRGRRSEEYTRHRSPLLSYPLFSWPLCHKDVLRMHGHVRILHCIFLSFDTHLRILVSSTPGPARPSSKTTTHNEPPHIFALISASNAFSLSKSVFCCGHPILMPSSAFGFGI